MLGRLARLLRAAGYDTLLAGGGTADERLLAQALRAAFRIDWLHAPFTRCLVDNTVVRPVSAAETGALPPSIRGLPGPFNTCPCCGRLYWPGSHVRRLSMTLERLSRRRL